MDRFSPGGTPGSAGFGEDHALPTGFGLSTDLVRHIAQVPVAYISLIGTERLCFFADPQYADLMFMNQPIVIEDLREHPRFYDHPLVNGQSGFVFWAAFPMITEEGFMLGALCLADRRPRQLGGTELELVRRISEELMGFLRKNTQGRDRLSQKMERLLGALQRRAGVEDTATAVSFLRMCEGYPPSQRDEILLPAANLAKVMVSGERLQPTKLAQELMTEHHVSPPPPTTKATPLLADDVLIDMLTALSV